MSFHPFLKLISRFVLSLSFITLIYPDDVIAKTAKVKKVKVKKKKIADAAAVAPVVSEPPTAVMTSFQNVPVDVQVHAQFAYMIDDDTGDILLEKNADVPMQPASMTKIMTAYMVADKLQSGAIRGDQQFIVGKNGYQTEGSSMFLNIGDQVSVMDLLKGLIIQSGNDTSVTLAENISGSEAAFAREMTRKAASLGATHTNFVNASGLPHDQHVTTARDLALISHHVIHDQPEYYHIYGEKDFTYNHIKQDNRNPLLSKNMGCDGIKTGHTSASGYGMVASCKEDNRRLILVVHGLKNMQARADEAKTLMTWGMRTFMNKTIATSKEVMSTIAIRHGIQNTIGVSVAKDAIITVPRSFEKDVVVTINHPDQMIAPIQKGDQLGTITVKAPFYKQDKIFPLVAMTGVPKANFFVCFYQDFMNFFTKDAKQKPKEKGDVVREKKESADRSVPPSKAASNPSEKGKS